MPFLPGTRFPITISRGVRADKQNQVKPLAAGFCMNGEDRARGGSLVDDVGGSREKPRRVNAKMCISGATKI